MLRITYDLGGAPIEVNLRETSEGFLLSSRQVERLSNVSLHFSIRVPSEFDIDFNSNGGGLVIENLSGRFSGKTMGGALKLSAVFGEADLKTMGGEVVVTDSELDGEVQTMGGPVEVRDVVGDVEVTSMGGVVSYHNVRDSEGNLRGPQGNLHPQATVDTIQHFTMGGSIEIEEAPSGADVKTMGGKIQIENAERFVNAWTGGGDIDIHSLSGPVDVWTGGGDIEVDANDGGIKAFTGAGTIEVRVDQDPGLDTQPLELQSGYGDVVLELPAGFSGKLDLEVMYTRSSDQNYQIVSDIPLQLDESQRWIIENGQQKKYVRGSGITGGGSRLVRVRTSNGNIIVRLR
jgi:DUF4097 and DUF4098 domain-containing protein YvlB